ncbi:MAG: RusA family crossover junction endodeoxyribonuclease [Clostridium sp.]|uniref:RusA family crossover junction endodeoxyribonuclease n=1 Tax=Clostridium sp. TaxID=1506 RepID=UPI00290D071D|nr:RusA family crossover junction endodeoxyribonuclease [Clostridium sp.]MDU7337582.1 RusA family crossover junction endodeoxyribonuclease [Clostridium sp.]
MAWIQVDDGIKEHDKIYNLADTLKISNVYAVGLMVCFWTWAVVSAPDGNITKFPPRAFSDDAQLAMQITAFYPIPKSKSKRIQAEMISGVIRPTKKPDCDNVIKTICDALNELAYKDDAQIVITQMSKYYGEVPRTLVKIIEVSAHR